VAETGFYFIYGKRLRRKMIDKGATKDDPKAIDELGLSELEQRTLKRNVFIGKVVEITGKDGKKRYYVKDTNT
jgi:hypothetical protein